MGRAAFVTGATGALGPHLLTELLRTDAFDRVYFLVGRGGGLANEERLRDLKSAVSHLATLPDDRRAVRLDCLAPVAGDIREPDLGFQADAAAVLARHIDLVIHAAADTRLTASADDLAAPR